jgi:hypothetical protein
VATNVDVTGIVDYARATTENAIHTALVNSNLAIACKCERGGAWPQRRVTRVFANVARCSTAAAVSIGDIVACKALDWLALATSEEAVGFTNVFECSEVVEVAVSIIACIFTRVTSCA